MRQIDADALMKVIREHDYPLRSHFNSTDNGMFTIGVQQAADEAPTIDAVPVVHGEWVHGCTDGAGTEFCYCSACGEDALKDKGGYTEFSRYCPNCGAKMDKEG